MLLSKVKQSYENNKSRADFFKIISMHYPTCSREYKMIELAYTTAEEAFATKHRDDGDAYFSHLRATTLIIIVHLRILKWEVICAALLHDIIEDIAEWPFERICLVFGDEVAALVWWVTKPPVEDFGGSRTARNRFYHERLHRAPRFSLIIKLVDRLHNMLTLWDTTPEKRERKLTETQDFYLVLAESEIILIHELEAAIDTLRNGRR